jgi:hypothetical protein
METICSEEEQATTGNSSIAHLLNRYIDNMKVMQEILVATTIDYDEVTMLICIAVMILVIYIHCHNHRHVAFLLDNHHHSANNCG